MDSHVDVRAVSQLDLFGLGASCPGDAAQVFSDALQDSVRSRVRSQSSTHADAEVPQLGLALTARPLNDFGWTEAEIFGLLERTLVDYLKMLGDERTSKETRAELIEWVAAPLQKPCAAARSPFSFQGCCYAAGVDPEEMQELVLAMFSPARLAQLT